MTLKKRGCYLVLLISFCIVLDSVLVSSVRCVNTIPVSTPKPTLSVEFDESSTILSAAFTDSRRNPYTIAGPYDVNLENTRFKYKVQELLINGRYIFTVEAEDVFGNKQEYCENYDLQIAPLKLTLEQPSYGVSANKTFTGLFRSDSEAVCRYSFVLPLPYFTPTGGMISFDQTDFSEKHTKEFPRFDFENTAYHIYVKCNRTDGLLNEDNPFLFNLSVDTTKPVIEDTYIYPGYNNEVVDTPAQTNMYVKTDDLSRCKFGIDKLNFSDMDKKFDGFESERFSRLNKVFLNNLADNETYKFNIACENEAELVSGTANYSFHVNLAASNLIQIKKPPRYVKDIPVNLEIFTNKKANCKYTDDPTMFTDAFNTVDQFTHTVALNDVKNQGEFTYHVLCNFLDGSSARQAHTFTLDKTGPTIANISSVNTCKDGELSASWAGQDALSKVVGYEYRIDAGANTLKDWTATTEASAIYQAPNLSSTATYFLKVKGKDEADNWGMEFTNSKPLQISDSKADKCLEKVPPIGDIITSIENNVLKVAVTCQDTGSGCNLAGTFYGQSSTAACTAALQYTVPVSISEDVLFCWKVADNAGNTAEGSRQLSVTKDSDNDGVVDGVDSCPNTPAGEAVDAAGCSSSQLDSDKDTVSDGSDKCPGTPAGVEVDEEGCPLDSDNDGMPDYWEILYGLDPESPDDADEDLDDDGITNLQEFLAGTDPTIAEEGAGAVSDEDQDGVPDDKDKCPGTKPGENVDNSGCSEYDLDEDSDGIPDDWEEMYCGGDCDPDEDLDGDGLTNYEEYMYCQENYCDSDSLDPTNPDTDGDGVMDGKEAQDETDPTDPEDFKKSKVLQLALFIIGIISLFGGIGYLAYKKLKKPNIQYVPGMDSPVLPRIPSTGRNAPISQTPVMQRVKTAQTRDVSRQQLTPQQKRKQEIRKLLKKKSDARKHEMGDYFGKFSEMKEGGIHKIELPEKKQLLHKQVVKHRGIEEQKAKMLEKKAVIEQKKEIKPGIKHEIKPGIKPEIIPDIKKKPEYEKLGLLLKAKSDFDKLAKLSALKKADIKKLVDSKDKMAVAKIFQELDLINKGKPKEKRVMAFGELSNLVKGRSDVAEKDIFKELPAKLVPESRKEAEAFNKLESMTSGKKGGLEELYKMQSKKSTLEKLSNMAKKGGKGGNKK